ncbi:MAG: PAS domain S-box protein [Verrucomicrobiota bacterium]|nr:PAS domain S-box protein [Verrucomicrobiota bacterium]
MTKMRISEQEIRDADIFEILLDNFPDMIHSIDQEGNIVYANKTAERLLGYTVEEFLKMNIRQIYAEEVLDAVARGFTDLKRKGDKSVESVLKAKSGEKIPVEIRSFGIYNDNGKFIRTFSILRDVRQIKELQQSLVHAGRLAAIGELASGVAHDISNPLTVILLSNEMILNALGARKSPLAAGLEQVCSFAQNSQKASKAILKLSEHLRNFSRGVAEQRERIDLYDAVADALFMTNNKIQKARVMVRNTVPRRAHFIMGSPNQVEQVFVNLIGNACDAMEERPERILTLSVSPIVIEAGQAWRCDVADTGAGIPDAIREEMFHSFFTTKPKGKGTGLGLSICRGIVADHKGVLQLASEVGKGAIFSVCLPRADAPADAAAASGRPGRS